MSCKNRRHRYLSLAGICNARITSRDSCLLFSKLNREFGPLPSFDSTIFNPHGFYSHPGFVFCQLLAIAFLAWFLIRSYSLKLRLENRAWRNRLLAELGHSRRRKSSPATAIDITPPPFQTRISSIPLPKSLLLRVQITSS